MGWHVSIGGKVTGPVSDEQVREIASKGLSGVFICAEGSKVWMPLERSPFALPAAAPVAVVKPTGADVMGQALLLLPVAVGFVYRFAVAPYTPVPLLWLTVIATSFLVAVDAALCGMGSEKDNAGKVGSGALVWWFATLLLWIAAYPFYLYERGKYGRLGRGWWGLASALAMLGLMFV